jgi:hypothetical protein
MFPRAVTQKQTNAYVIGSGLPLTFQPHEFAVKDGYISCIDPPAYPIASLGCFPPDVAVGALNPNRCRPEATSPKSFL